MALPAVAYPVLDTFVEVFADGTHVPRDTSHLDGWDYVDLTDTSIELYGPTCDALLAGQIQSVTITYRCPVP
jgi:hypothetical protein